MMKHTKKGKNCAKELFEPNFGNSSPTQSSVRNLAKKSQNLVAQGDFGVSHIYIFKMLDPCFAAHYQSTNRIKQ